ncbi:hypothetical protein [Elioraea sp.]|uniref:hypothetical protein n=1 Tax=Elioraea sp. TaxID=2185103 RepID=UPI0025B9E0EC|nr:hypothetical protein [Elioraea sp.]
MMLTGIAIWLITIAAALVLWRRDRPALAKGGRFAVGTLKNVLPIMLLALPMAGFLTVLVPDRFAAILFGAETGLRGHLLATVVGALIPGGPFVSFPIVLALWNSGAGAAQMVTLISAWSVLAVNRVIVWEAPLMGWRFVLLRLVTGFWLPLASGLLAEAMLALLPPGSIGR